ncbi:extracellular solute-binding protein [Thermotoga sp. 38H-to]|uniref:ABC transporter substrate-binding protein n=1 Tax=Thermotoga sp. 38H-to TaxID=1755812 RepID=UPI0013ECAF92|nr:extracellular solute-binding protein [Thermotoga sp. 38H-to]KAF2959110.1 hypothetical protein AS158_08680 [Thermotoga sp. 38H-to]
MRKLVSLTVLCVLTILGLTVFGKVTLELWSLSPAVEGAEVNPDIALAIELFKKDFPEVEFKTVTYSVDTYKTKLAVAMASGELPDLFFTWGGGQLRSYIDSGQIHPLSDETVEWMKKTFWPGALEEVYYKGKYWAVPFNNSILGDFLWYRKDIFEKHGLQPPKTWSEFVALCKKLRELGYIPITMGNKARWPADHFLATLAARVCGNEVVKEILNGKRSWKDPLMLKTLEKLVELIKVGAFPEAVNALDFNTGEDRALFYVGKAAMICELSFMYQVIKEERPDLIPVLGMAKFPIVEDGKGDPRELVGIVGDWFYSIVANSSNKELAEKFLREYLLHPEVVRMKVEKRGTLPPVYGIEELPAIKNDPFLSEIVKAAMEAPSVMHCWDTYLPPEIAEVYLDNLQKLMDLKITPEKFAETMDKTVEEYKKAHSEYGQ